MEVHQEERKYFLNTLPRQVCANTTETREDDIAWLARSEDTVLLDASLVGCQVVVLLRMAGMRLTTTCLVLTVGPTLRSLAGEMQTLVHLRREDDTSCIIGLSRLKLWTRDNDHFDFHWYVCRY